MRIAIFGFCIVFGSLTMLSCGGGKSQSGTANRNESGMLLQEGKSADGAKSLQSSKAESNFTFRDVAYSSIISREPDETLPKVMSEMGDLYTDNKVELILLRAGNKIFNKTFTKQDFSSIIDNAFLRKSILEGMVFNKTTSAGFMFAASICYPQTDLYIPVSITITPDGKVSMKKDEQLEDIYSSDEV